MVKAVNVIIEKDMDEYFVASVPKLRGCHTHVKTLDKLMERIKEAVALCLEVGNDDGEANQFIGVLTQ